jgi:hypothetical protein
MGIGRLLLMGLGLAGGLLADERGDQLLAATRKGDLAAVKALLDQGADVNAKSAYGSTALFFAADRGNLEIAQLLLERGANPNVEDTFYSASALTWAMDKLDKAKDADKERRQALLMLLVEKGAAPGPLAAAAIQRNKMEMLQVALDKGQWTPEALSEMLAVAEMAKRAPMVEALKAKGAKPYDYQPAAEELQAYVGKFVDDGGGITVVFGVKEGKLTVTQQGFTMTLVPVKKDFFKAVQAGLDLRFEREGEAVNRLVLPGRGGNTILKRVVESK